jgi:hypothetical protein
MQGLLLKNRHNSADIADKIVKFAGLDVKANTPQKRLMRQAGIYPPKSSTDII